MRVVIRGCGDHVYEATTHPYKGGKLIVKRHDCRQLTVIATRKCRVLANRLEIKR